jgi:hypothetical protein
MNSVRYKTILFSLHVAERVQEDTTHLSDEASDIWPHLPELKQQELNLFAAKLDRVRELVDEFVEKEKKTVKAVKVMHEANRLHYFFITTSDWFDWDFSERCADLDLSIWDECGVSTYCMQLPAPNEECAEDVMAQIVYDD